MIEKLKSIMNEKNKTIGRYYNAKNKDIELALGDWVMLKNYHICTTRSCKKLSEKHIRPFEAIEKNHSPKV